MTSPARSRMPRCFMIANRDRLNGRHRAPVVNGASRSRSRMRRRVGSASARQTVSSCFAFIGDYLVTYLRRVVKRKIVRIMGSMDVFRDKAVFITGASSGIGKATAIRLATLGAQVTLSARNRDALEQVRAEIQAAGGAAFVAPADVTDADAV